MRTSSTSTDDGQPEPPSTSDTPTPRSRPNTANPQQGAPYPPVFPSHHHNIIMETPPRRIFKVPPHRKDTRKLFVGGLPANITEQEFQEFFQQFGTLIDSVVMFDRDTRRSRGFGFVTFEDPEVCRQLLLMGNEGADPNTVLNLVGRLEMQGKVCEIKAATPKEGRAPRRNILRMNENGPHPPMHHPHFDSPPHPGVPAAHPYGFQYGYLPPHAAVPGHHFYPPGGYIPPNFGQYPADYGHHLPTPPVDMVMPPPVGMNVNMPPGGLAPHFPPHMSVIPPPDHMMMASVGGLGGPPPGTVAFGGGGGGGMSVMQPAPVGNHHHHGEENGPQNNNGAPTELKGPPGG